MIDDPSLMLDRSLREISDLLEVELNDRIRDGKVPLVGMSLEGLSNNNVPMKLEVRLSIREG